MVDAFSNTIPIEPTAEQLSLMTLLWSENSITATGTTGVIGMFGSKIGSEDEYFYYMKFTPFVNIATTSTTGKFRIWFEMGEKG